ncbi:MAG: peptidase domain-containing ABC transporter [Cytophagales bacterium]|nr:peptidase domain-containing ABC transporter [Cytophagales bacterium]
MSNVKVKQRDITDCGAACLSSICAHYGLFTSVTKIRQHASTDKKGTNLLGMVEGAQKLGFEAKGVKGKMDSLPKIPLPAVAHIIVKEALQHYVVIYEVTDKQVNYMDPGDGQMHKVTLADFEKIWTTNLLLLLPDDTFQQANEQTSLVTKFWRLLKPHTGIMLQALFGAVVYTIIGLSTSIYVQKIVDHVLPSGNLNLLNLLSIGMIVLLVFQLLINVIRTKLVISVGQQVDARLVIGFFKHLMGMPQFFFDSMRNGEIISRINDALKIRNFVIDVSLNFLVNIFILIASFALMFTYYWKLGLVLLAVIPGYFIIYLITNKLNKKVERKVMEGAAELESHLVESLNNIKTIKNYELEEFSGVKTEFRFVSLLRTLNLSANNHLFSTASGEVISKFLVIVLFWVGAGYVLQQIITPGELMSFYALIGYFTSPVTGIIGMNKTYQNAKIAADRLFEILEQEKEEQNESEISADELGDICFEDVGFRYGSRQTVFEEANFILSKGKITAIVGESGSGKSTIASLVQKLYRPQSGSISIGGYNINTIATKSLITIVPQHIELFAGSVIENIAVGQYTPDIKQVVEACKKIDLHEFIEAMPNQYQTYIGENGMSLSGGQRQRLAMARALYRNPEVYILDEATSSMDGINVGQVKTLILDLKALGKTIILITHQEAMKKIADEILVVKNGKVSLED